MLGVRATLTFSITVVETEDDEGRKVPVAEVTPLVNGKPVLPHSNSRPFDALAVLQRRDDRGEFDLYTCSCGVAGCAGIFEPVRLLSENGDVTWALPEEPYRTALDAAQEGLPLALSFKRRQYLAALDGLEVELLQLAESNAGMRVAPFSGYGTEMPLKQILRDGRDWHLVQHAREIAFENAFQPLLSAGLAVVIRADELTSFWLTPQLLSYLVSSREEPIEDRKAAWARLVSELQVDAGAALRALDWDELRTYAQPWSVEGARWCYGAAQLPATPWEGALETARVELAKAPGNTLH